MDDFATGYLAGQDGGNNNSGFFGNEGLWAVIILAIIFGWGTNGYGRNGGDNGMNSYIPYLVGTGATGQGGADTRAALSEGFYQQDTSRSLAGIQSGICSLGYDQLAQINGINANIANGFAGVNSAICQLGYQRSGAQRVQRRQCHQPCHHAGGQRPAGWTDRTCHAAFILLLREQAAHRRPEVHHRNGGLRYPSGYRRQRPRHRGQLQRQLPQHDGLLHAGQDRNSDR